MKRKFKVGDRVAKKYDHTIYYGIIREIKSCGCPFLIEYEKSFPFGHDGNGLSKKIYPSNRCLWELGEFLEYTPAFISIMLKQLGI